ncbi:hypothetical protein FH063_000368 [Azospirillum argentinense]|uniref:Uncharacterized protein n=1 Tax=Azospirillum argentinense TaxID=2970906 RepID=A0A5B0L3G1_9PROT|nr:hypothetical protein FH063_000368 [Azospirillum argentinense]
MFRSPLRDATPPGDRNTRYIVDLCFELNMSRRTASFLHDPVTLSMDRVPAFPAGRQDACDIWLWCLEHAFSDIVVTER